MRVEKLVEPRLVMRQRIVDAHRRRHVVEFRNGWSLACSFCSAWIKPMGLRVSSTRWVGE